MMRPCLPGKITRRLLDIGWLKREDEEERWSNKDREALEAYDKRPLTHGARTTFPNPSGRCLLRRGE